MVSLGVVMALLAGCNGETAPKAKKAEQNVEQASEAEKPEEQARQQEDVKQEEQKPEGQNSEEQKQKEPPKQEVQQVQEQKEQASKPEQAKQPINPNQPVAAKPAAPAQQPQQAQPVNQQPTQPAQTQPEPKKETAVVTLSVRGNGSTILRKTEVELQANDTVFTVLSRTLRKQGIPMEHTGSGSSVYVQGIQNLYEGDFGPTSGWMYSVNGVFVNKSAGAQAVKKGDNIEWVYTENLGKDVGAKP